MSLRSLVVLLAVLAAMVSALVWLHRRDETATPPTTEAPLIRNVDADSVRALELNCGGSTVKLSRRPNADWRIVEPEDALADTRRVAELLAALQNARARKTIADGSSQAGDFGLDPPACRVALWLEAKPSAVTLRIGRPSPVGTERYAAGEDGKIVLTDGSLYGVVSRNADGFREKRSIPVEPDAITRIILDRPDASVVLTSTDGIWRIEKPRADLASASACTELARAIASIEDKGSATSKRVKVEVGVRGREAPLVAELAADAAPELARPWESFRETRIVSFSPSDVRELTVTQGDKHLILNRTGDGAATFTEFVDKLSGLTAEGFESETPKGSAVGTIVVSGERRELVRLSWGTLGSKLWITTSERPGAIFRVDATAADLSPKPVVFLAKHRIGDPFCNAKAVSIVFEVLEAKNGRLGCPPIDDLQVRRGFPPPKFTKVGRNS